MWDLFLLFFDHPSFLISFESPFYSVVGWEVLREKNILSEMNLDKNIAIMGIPK